MTTFTDKELIKEIKERIGSLDVRDNIERRAYEIALASLEAEPVAWMRDDADGREYNARNEFSGGGGGVPLYATPPAPVVPEEKPMPNPLSMYAVDAVAAIAEVRGWNACRAAMLHGAEPVSQTYKLNELSGNYPVTPDGWISCSERMPAQDDWILIYSKHGEYMAGQVQGEYVELSDGTLSWLGNALYWMPLPEPPQEVN
ncbi:DUF551 domain-containing protein [Escherichia coli]|uniref:DUF551 domain-containing protein n=2 Tax=Escherichia coli TaxID=562 RepID=UPI003D1574F9